MTVTSGFNDDDNDAIDEDDDRGSTLIMIKLINLPAEDGKRAPTQKSKDQLHVHNSRTVELFVSIWLPGSELLQGLA